MNGRHVVVLVISTLAGVRAAAQSAAPWGPDPAGRLVSIDLARPSWDGADLSVASGLLYGGVRVPVSSGLAVVGQVPYARFGVDEASGAVIGNLYVGMEGGSSGPRGARWDLGVRLPTTSESGDFDGFAGVLAALSDFDRAEAWLDEVWAATGHVGYRSVSAGGLQAGFAVGGTLWSSQNGDDEVLADYRAHLAYRQEAVAIGAEFTGRALLTESDVDFSERTIHQLTIGVGVRAGPLWPRAFLRIPLDADLKDAGLNQVFGIGADWRF